MKGCTTLGQKPFRNSKNNKNVSIEFFSRAHWEPIQSFPRVTSNTNKLLCFLELSSSHRNSEIGHMGLWVGGNKEETNIFIFTRLFCIKLLYAKLEQMLCSLLKIIKSCIMGLESLEKKQKNVNQWGQSNYISTRSRKKWSLSISLSLSTNLLCLFRFCLTAPSIATDLRFWFSVILYFICTIFF